MRAPATSTAPVRNRLRLGGISLALVLAAGCMAPAPDIVARMPGGEPDHAAWPADTGIAARIRTLELHGDHEAILGLADEARGQLQGVSLARVELAVAKALAARGRVPSALVGFSRAERIVRDAEQDSAIEPALPRAIQRAWADAELSLGRRASAARRYEAALAYEPMPVREREALCFSAYVAHREAGDGEAAAWRARVRDPHAPALAALEHRLLTGVPLGVGSVSSAVIAAASGSIPADPRFLVPGVRTRAEWGARPINGSFEAMEPVRRITVHHTARPLPAANRASTAAEMRAIQDLHQVGNRWADIGYHFLIDADGNVWEGRALRYQGAHAGNGELNRGNVGVCVLGDFDRRAVGVAQRVGLKRLLDSLCEHFAVGPTTVETHQEVRPEPTACPGRHLQAWVTSYRLGASSTLARQ